MRLTVTPEEVAAARKEILDTLPPSLITDKQFHLAVWHLRSPSKTGHKEIVKLARDGDVDAREAINELISDYAADQVDPPIELHMYVHDKGTDELVTPRGRPRLRNWPRDFWIFCAMRICERMD